MRPKRHFHLHSIRNSLSGCVRWLRAKRMTGYQLCRSRRQGFLRRLREFVAAGSRNHLPEIGRTSPNSCGCGDIAFGS